MGMGRVRLRILAVALVVAACGDPDSAGTPVTGPAAATSSSGSTAGTSSAPSTALSELSTTPTTDAVPSTSAAAPPVQPPETTLAAIDGPLAFCDTEPPPMEQRGREANADDERLTQQWAVFADLVVAHPDVLTGAWWDAAAAEIVVLVADAPAARPLVADVTPGGVRYRIEAVSRSYDDLVALSQPLVQAAHDAKLAHSGSVRMDGRVEVDLAVRDRASVDGIAALAGDDADVVCVRGGADSATVVSMGPQPMSGDGWRLLVEPGPHRAGAPISIASSAAEYGALWSALGVGGSSPPVDFGHEVVIAVVNGEPPGCENRLVGLTFDLEARHVRVQLVLPGGERPCRAMASTRTYVVAVARSRLPALPFRIVNHGDQCASPCPGDPLDVTSL